MDCPIVTASEFPAEQYFSCITTVKKPRGNQSGKKRTYIDLVTAFDIESSTIGEQAFMYIWQWQFGSDYTVIGRSWEEFLTLQARIMASIPPETWLVVFVHNLSYEFQFLKGIYHFVPDDIFAIASRKVLKCDMHGCFEFRCSYRLTNMSLDQFTRKMGVEHSKLSGAEFDYSKTRYPWTELSAQELAYCVHDVLGLVEALQALMARDGDTLYTIPLTSTGYVRRNAKMAMRGAGHHSFVHYIFPDMDLYYALREAFRGGNTHANRYFTGDLIEHVHSADRSSSYPAVMCNCEYPMTEFIPFLPHDCNIDYAVRAMKIRHKALLLRIGIRDLKLRDPFWGCPYLSTDKCRKLVHAKDTADNGRLLAADYLETTVTDIDLRIIMEEYDGELIILQGWYSTYKPLPRPLVDEVITYYHDKTVLKGVPGQEIYYDKSKALLNSLYGMMAQDPVKHQPIFQQVGDWEDDKIPAPELLDKARKKAFLCYQWGVWVTAHARYALERGIRLVHDTLGAYFVYCDTDSVKYTGTVDWTAYNAERKEECEKSGAFATDPAGITHYMGVFETEDKPETGEAYRYFKTLGAKKYAYQEMEGGETHCTIAGVNKALGGKELDAHGGLAAFKEGFVFEKAGGTQAIYNDEGGEPLTIDGHHLEITANVAILPSEYTLGITGEYERIIKFAKSYLLNPYFL